MGLFRGHSVKEVAEYYDEFKDKFNLVEGQKVGIDAEIALLQKFNVIVEFNLGNDDVIARLVREAAKEAELKNTTIQNNKYNIKIFNWFHRIYSI